MSSRGDRDILLPEQRGPWRVVRELVSLLSPRPKAPSVVEDVGPYELALAFEYLAVRCEEAGDLLDDLAEVLAARIASLRGHGRFLLQCKLADALNRPESGRFLLALHLATRVPVPQARTALLQMLTRGDMARWAFERQGSGDTEQAAAGENGTSQGQSARQTFDLRPAVVAALGQLRDPSLLGLFHRLLEKLSRKPVTSPAIVAAVHWALMNLAPGGQGEPVPVGLLRDRAGKALAEPAGSGPRGVPQPPVDGNGHAAGAEGLAKTSLSSAAKSSERDDLLAGF